MAPKTSTSKIGSKKEKGISLEVAAHAVKNTLSVASTKSNGKSPKNVSREPSPAGSRAESPSPPASPPANSSPAKDPSEVTRKASTNRSSDTSSAKTLDVTRKHSKTPSEASSRKKSEVGDFNASNKDSRTDDKRKNSRIAKSESPSPDDDDVVDDEGEQVSGGSSRSPSRAPSPKDDDESLISDDPTGSNTNRARPSGDSHVGLQQRSSARSMRSVDSPLSSSDGPRCVCGNTFMLDSQFCRMCGKRRAAVEELEGMQDSDNSAQLTLPGSDDQMRLLKKKEKKPPGHNIALAFEIYPIEDQRLDYLNELVVKIQSRWRGVSARKEWGETVNLRKKAALKIQAFKRGREDRRWVERKTNALKVIQRNLRSIEQRRKERIALKKTAQVKAREQGDPKQLLIDAFNAALKDLWNRDRYSPEVAASNLGHKLQSTQTDVAMAVQELQQLQLGVDREQLSKICASMEGLMDVFKLTFGTPVTPLYGARDLFEEMLETAGNEAGMIGFEELRAIHAGRKYTILQHQKNPDSVADRRRDMKDQQNTLHSVFDKCPKIEGTALVDKAEIARLCGSDRDICNMFGVPIDVKLTPASGTREIFDKILHVASKARRESLPPISWNEFYQLYEFPEMSTGRVEGAEMVTNRVKDMMGECPTAWPKKVHSLIQENLLDALLKVDSMMTTFNYDGRIQARDETEKRLERLNMEKLKLDEKMEIVSARVELEGRGIFDDAKDSSAMAQIQNAPKKKSPLSARDRRKAEKQTVEVARSRVSVHPRAIVDDNGADDKEETDLAYDSIELMEVFRSCMVDDAHEVRRYKYLLDGASGMIASVKDKLYETDRESASSGKSANDKFRAFLADSYRVIEHVIEHYLKEAAALQPLAEDRMSRHPLLLSSIRSYNAALDKLLSKRQSRIVTRLESHRDNQENYECNIEDAELEIRELQAELEELEEEWHEELVRQSSDIAEGLKVVDHVVDSFSAVMKPILEDLSKTESCDRSQTEEAVIEHLTSYASDHPEAPMQRKSRPPQLGSFTSTFDGTPAQFAHSHDTLLPNNSKGELMDRVPSNVRFAEDAFSATPKAGATRSKSAYPRLLSGSALNEGADWTESRVSETSSTDDVNIGDMMIYGRTLAKILSKGNSDLYSHVQLFFESCVAEADNRTTFQSDIPPLLTPMKNLPDGPTMQRIVLTLKVQRKGDMCEVWYKSVCSILTQDKDGDGMSSVNSVASTVRDSSYGQGKRSVRLTSRSSLASEEAPNLAMSDSDDAESPADESALRSPRAIEAFGNIYRIANAVDKKDIQELASFVTPPPLVSKTMELISTLLQEDTDWDSIQSMITDPDFLQRLKDFDQNSIPTDVVEALEETVKDEGYTPAAVGSESKAAEKLCSWAFAIHEYVKRKGSMASNLAADGRRRRNTTGSILVANSSIAAMRENRRNSDHSSTATPNTSFYRDAIQISTNTPHTSFYRDAIQISTNTAEPSSALLGVPSSSQLNVPGTAPRSQAASNLKVRKESVLPVHSTPVNSEGISNVRQSMHAPKRPRQEQGRSAKSFHAGPTSPSKSVSIVHSMMNSDRGVQSATPGEARGGTASTELASAPLSSKLTKRDWSSRTSQAAIPKKQFPHSVTSSMPLGGIGKNRRAS